jgi:hypothetical protein
MAGGTRRPVSGAGTGVGVGTGVGDGVGVGRGVAVGEIVGDGSDDAEDVGSGGRSLTCAAGEGLEVAVGLPSDAAATAITSTDAPMTPIAPSAVFRFKVVVPPAAGDGCHWSIRMDQDPMTAWRRIAEVAATGA